MLQDVKLRNAKAAEKAYKIHDNRGLFIIVTARGGRWWRLKYRFAGKEKTISLGIYPDVSLAQARDRRDEARKLLASGIDPSAERQAQKAALKADKDLFEALSRVWFEKFSAGWAPTHAATVIRRLERDVFPWIGAKPIAEISAVQLLEVLRRVETRGALETAHRIKQIIGQVFRYAIATGKASRDPSADLRGALPPVREEHHASLTKPTEVAALMRTINGYQGTFVVKCALRLAPLVFVRPGELRKAEWSEFDLDSAMWRISAERMKMRTEHLVPLSRQAVEILRELHHLTGAARYVFPSVRTTGRAMSENAVLAALRRMGYERDQMTGHGFRTMASTLLHELGWSADAIERQLAHAERDGVRDAYNRAEYLAERRRMMQAWADYLEQLTASVATSSEIASAGPA